MALHNSTGVWRIFRRLIRGREMVHWRKPLRAEVPWTETRHKEFQMSLSFSKFIPWVIVFVGCN